MPKKTTKVERNYKELNLKGVTVVGITQPKTVKSIATEQGINTEEVYIRLIYKQGKEEYRASQKLSILGKEDYKKLLSIAGTDEKINLDLTVYEDNNGETQAFFNMEDNTSVDELFENPVERTTVKRAAAPASLLASLLGSK